MSSLSNVTNKLPISRVLFPIEDDDSSGKKGEFGAGINSEINDFFVKRKKRETNTEWDVDSSDEENIRRRKIRRNEIKEKSLDEYVSTIVAKLQPLDLMRKKDDPLGPLHAAKMNLKQSGIIEDVLELKESRKAALKAAGDNKDEVKKKFDAAISIFVKELLEKIKCSAIAYYTVQKNNDNAEDYEMRIANAELNAFQKDSKRTWKELKQILGVRNNRAVDVYSVNERLFLSFINPNFRKPIDTLDDLTENIPYPHCIPTIP